MQIVIPTLERSKGEDAFDALAASAGIEVEPCIVVDSDRDGYTRTVNRGLERATWPVCICVDDVRPTSDRWLETLLETFELSEDVWFVGPSGNCRTPPQNSGRPGDNREPRRVSHLAGFCLLVRDVVREDVGLLDETFAHYGSDVDWQWRARRHGGRAVWVPGVYVKHELHAPHADWFESDNLLFRSRYGG